MRTLARALGGEVVSGQVVAPGPGHSKRDRSLAVRLAPGAADGFVVTSHASDDWRECRDYVKARAGLDAWRPERGARPAPIARERAPPPREPDRPPPFNSTAGGRLWAAATSPGGTPVEDYLTGERALTDFDHYRDGGIIRWLPRDLFAGKPCMIALLRNVFSGEPQGVLRTFICDGKKKHDRLFRNSNAQAVIMLDAFEDVTYGLMLGEGFETCADAREKGFRPIWAGATTSTIGSFPLLPVIESLTLLRENDGGASDAACGKCAATWLAGGREVRSHRPPPGAKDLNDLTRQRLAQ